MKLLSSILFLLASTSEAYQPSKVQGRRGVFKSIAAGTAFAGYANLVGLPNVAEAVEACPKGSSNCIRTTWTPPSGTSKKDSLQQVKAVIESYPQEGQQKVDLGGWSIAEDSGDRLRVEFKSGIGKFAKFFNGGKPFVDDMIVEVKDDGAVEVRSSSRVGESDFGVNQKRLTYFQKKFNDLGWNAPDPAY